jgi:hypothetical protein
MGRDLRLVFGKFEGCGIYAVTLAGWRGAVIEDVAEVGIAPGAEYLGPAHSQAVVFFKSNIEF